MNKLNIFLLYLLLTSCSKHIICAKVIFINRTGKDIKIKIQPHGVNDSDAARIDLSSNEASILTDAKINHRISWTYASVGNWKSLMGGRQYKDRDISLASDKDDLIIITGHGKGKSNYIEIELEEDDATNYIEAINTINAISNYITKLDAEYKKRYSEKSTATTKTISLIIGQKDPFDFYLNNFFPQGKGLDIEELLFELKEKFLNIQKAQKILEPFSSRVRLNGYGETTSNRIKYMLEKIAEFLEHRPDVPTERIIHKPRIELLSAKTDLKEIPSIESLADQEPPQKDSEEDEQVNKDAHAEIKRLLKMQSKEE